MEKTRKEPNDERFVSLEVKLAYLEKTALELNDVVALQQRRIEALELQLQRVGRHLRDERDDRELPHDEPPHY